MRQRKYNLKSLLFIGFLFLIISYPFFSSAQETAPGITQSEIELEKKMTQEAEGQKQEELKGYFRKYYYKQGKELFNKERYEEAIAKFRRTLYWDPEYKPARRYIELIEDKIFGQYKFERKIPIQKQAREIQDKEEVIIESTDSTYTYRIDKEDVLEIDIWHHPELSREVIVRPDGMISFPLLGDIKAVGLTIQELDESITQGLSEFANKRLKPSVSEKAEEREEYLIGVGDTLDISVWKIADLSREVIVRPDGMVSFPLIDDMRAAGITLTQLDEELTKRLSTYVKEPQVSIMIKSFGWKKELPAEVFLEDKPEVSVMIKNFGGKRVIVLGEVAKPGVYTFNVDMRLIEALALAGDCTNYAVKKNVLVIRGDIHRQPQVIVSNVYALLKNARLSEDVLIQSGDIVYVPRSLIGDINAFLGKLVPVVEKVYKGATTKTVAEEAF